jgi:sugar-specific transcriptional regulator TrmB
MNEHETILRNLGLSEKGAQLYLACLRLGEATVLDLARESGLKRTTIYYILEELTGSGALVETKRSKKTRYVAADPKDLLIAARERHAEAEKSLHILEEQRGSLSGQHRVYFLYGPAGFKQIWNMILRSKDREYRIISAAEEFSGFIPEKYLLSEIIAKKKRLGFKSRQIVADSPLARKIIVKDTEENRTSKIMPFTSKIGFSEIITSEFVAFISPRYDNTLFVVEDELFAKTRQVIFDSLWSSLPTLPAHK